MWPESFAWRPGGAFLPGRIRAAALTIDRAEVAGPRISVVVPFFNVADLLGDCLRSIAAQTFGDFEVIMVDDGSTDGSTEIARAQAVADPRFILLQVLERWPRVCQEPWRRAGAR